MKKKNNPTQAWLGKVLSFVCSRLQFTAFVENDNVILGMELYVLIRSSLTMKIHARLSQRYFDEGSTEIYFSFC